MTKTTSKQTTPTRRLDILEAQFAAHPTLPREAVLKADLLRTGIRFEDDALISVATENGAVREHQPKSYFIFSFDMVRQKELDETQKWHAPEEIALSGGPWGLRRTIVSTRLNPASPYRVAPRDGALWLHVDETPVAEVGLRDLPPYYREKLPDGRPVAEIAPVIEWGYLRLPDCLPRLPVFRREGRMPVLRHQQQLPPADSGGASLHRRQVGRRRAGRAGAH